MPRTARALTAGDCYHVINRGNGKQTIFHDEMDYAGFVDLIKEAMCSVSMRLLAFCLMPNHFHLVLWPRETGDMGQWMHWLTTAHVARYASRYGRVGRIWQGRYKSFPVQFDDNLLRVLRYVERNAKTANLVTEAEDWSWGSLRYRTQRALPPFLTESPVTLQKSWVEWVNEPQTERELTAIRHSVRKGTPYGQSDWVVRTARRLDIEFTLRGPGRPRKP